MRILIAPDKFKGSLGAREVAENIAEGLRSVLTGAEIVILPMADGGEGTAAAICEAANGCWHKGEVHDAYGRLVTARFATVEGDRTAVLEASEAIGLCRIPAEKRDPMRASSFGAGELLLHAVRSGARKVIMGLGGSATNDCGFGLARALGFRFLDENEIELRGPVSDLLKLARIYRPALRDWPEMIAAVDVQNPLLGAGGATQVFGSQKGASPKELEVLERALTRLADVVVAETGIDQREVAGAGAAGGLGFGLLSFVSATLRPGFEIVSDYGGLEDAVRWADIVITGEGRLDAQTLAGKAPAGVAILARKHGKRCYAIVGSATPDSLALFDRVVQLAVPPITIDQAIKDAAPLLQSRATALAVSWLGPPAQPAA
ncbi:MAG: glycerate kinase [Chthoniobacterales bacterium]